MNVRAEAVDVAPDESSGLAGRLLRMVGLADRRRATAERVDAEFDVDLHEPKHDDGERVRVRRDDGRVVLVTPADLDFFERTQGRIPQRKRTVEPIWYSGLLGPSPREVREAMGKDAATRTQYERYFDLVLVLSGKDAAFGTDSALLEPLSAS